MDNLQAYNKASAAVAAGAVITIIAVILPPQWKTPEVISAAQTLLTAAIVFAVPNKTAQP